MRDMRRTTDFADIYDRYFSRVYNYVRYRLRSPEAADDVAGRVFEAALEKLGTYDPSRAPVQVWLFAIARNAIADWFRARGRGEGVSLEETAEPAAKEPRADSVLEKEQENAMLLEAVAALEPRSRDIIALKFSSGMTNRDIAAVTGLGESNVGVIIYRAVKRLQEALAEKKI
ncbi:MAG: RNA polymerase subunit sigma-24 [Elusimicrobia bacterium CG08_land_8_20_14_0_20_59_10]|nr:MAG: RNA polymerase subunit sigma-24 [Elusimicrobia bacterium CG08_land_8_20_14_0_20_59_10]